MPKIGVLQTKTVCLIVCGGVGGLGSQGTDNLFTTKFKLAIPFWALLSIMEVQWTLYTMTAF